MSLVYRFDLASKRIATLAATATAAMPDLLTDTLYTVDGAAVLPLYRGASSGGRWRSPIFVRNTIDSFGWAQVGGDFAGLATLRLYVDGALFHTVSAPADTPMRLPAGRGREWEIEVEVDSDIRLTTVTLSGSAEELRLAVTSRAA